MKNRIMGINDKAEIDALISRCLSGEALNEELVRLEKWISETSENRNYYFQIKNLWDVSFGAKDIENIHVERAYRQVIAHSSIGLGAKRLTYYLIRAAAVLFIPLLVGSYFWGRSTKTSADETGYKPVYNEVYAAFGTRSYIALSDGSGVWLNAGSRLKYPDKFTSDKREVYLTGEGYFEVNADASKPFVVNTKDLSVRATGTKFDVDALHFNSKIKVTLVSGKVTVSEILSENRMKKISDMRPNQHLEYDTLSGDISLSDEDIYRYIAWKDGKLVFRNEKLSDVLQKIGYFYNVDVELRGEELKEYRYRATFEEETFGEIMKLLKLSSPIDYYEVKREPLSDGSFPKKKIVIFPKDRK